MSEVVNFEGKSQAITEYDDTYFGNNSALSDGVGGALPVVSIKGSRWCIKYAGEDTVVTNADGDPKASLEAVIVAAKGEVSKIFYSEGYAEGDAEAPDCWSLNGVEPDVSSDKPQHSNCAACPQNQWGSRITEAGKKAKRCSDVRRVALVPANDIANVTFGGPMLLRIPAASLQDLKKFADGMSAQGFHHAKIVTRIGFDPTVAYPKLTWKAVRPLNPEEVTQVVEHLKSGAAEGVLEGTGSVVGDHAPASSAPAAAPAVDTAFEQPAAPVAPAPVAPVATAPAPAPAAPAPTELTPQQKAAKTRAANKVIKDAEAAAAPATAATFPGDPVPEAPVAPAPASLDADLNDILAGLET